MGEEAAAQYLQRSLGWQVVCRNWRCEAGELDIVALDADTRVVVEVRTRSAARCDEALASVNRRKQLRLRRLADWYAHTELNGTDRAVRVDVIAVALQDGVVQDLVHIRHADIS
jgi:putative endonuclease